MIILDTNVISELMRVKPAAPVARWTASLPWNSLCTTTITQAEILHGIQLLPRGKRRDALEEAARMMFDQVFSGRVFSFDGDAARAYARIVAGRHRAGRPISQFDAQIAAIASSTGCDLATRDMRDFEGCGLDLHDPWQG